MRHFTSDEWLQKANDLLDATSRAHVLEWKELPETKALRCLFMSNIEQLKEVWEIDQNSQFDNAVQNAKARGNVTAFKKSLEYLNDILSHLEEEDEEDAETSGTQSSDSTG